MTPEKLHAYRDLAKVAAEGTDSNHIPLHVEVLELVEEIERLKQKPVWQGAVDAPSGGVGLIAAERVRQVEGEGWTAEHDDRHGRSELAIAAFCYTRLTACMELGLVTGQPSKIFPPANWPWDKEWWKPSDDPVRNLVKAGALIAAEIDRLQRAQALRQQRATGEASSVAKAREDKS